MNEPKYIVRWNGNYALQFKGRGYEKVADKDATLFESEIDARDRVHQERIPTQVVTIEAFTSR
jgi:hypothetical protein